MSPTRHDGAPPGLVDRAARQRPLNVVPQGATDAIYTKDLQGRYTRLNAACARLMGRPAEAIIGHTDAQPWS